MHNNPHPHPTNLWQTVIFALENVTLERCLVPHPVNDYEQELSCASPVGQALLTARPGDTITANAPGGKVTIQVISIIPQKDANSSNKTIAHQQKNNGRGKDTQ